MPNAPDLLSPDTSFCQEIRWTVWGHGKRSIRVEGYRTEAHAEAAALMMATHLGWTPPRWWQWWRWMDTRMDIFQLHLLRRVTRQVSPALPDEVHDA